MKICLISAEYPPETFNGGIGTYTFNLAHYFVELGHKVTVISRALNKEEGYLDGKVNIYRIYDQKITPKFTRIGNLLSDGAFGAYLHSLSVFSKIKEITAKSGNFDVIEGPLWGAECCAYPSKLKIPMVVRLETPIFKQREILGLTASTLMEFLEKKSLEKATLIASISHNISSLIVKKYQIDPKKIEYSPLGVVIPKKLPPSRENARKLLFVGRLEKRKGIQELIEALAKILSADANITVDIVGKDCFQAPGNTSYADYFKKIVPAELRERVKFHGFINDQKLKTLYADCDVFIAPSRYESFGLIFLEAMAYGKPVIGTKTGGIPEIINEGQNGLLIDVNSPEQIVHAVLKLFSDNYLREKIGIRAYKDVRHKFSLEDMVKKSTEIYQKAILSFKKNE